jgi:hypothetical protein
MVINQHKNFQLHGKCSIFDLQENLFIEKILANQAKLIIKIFHALFLIFYFRMHYFVSEVVRERIIPTEIENVRMRKELSWLERMLFCNIRKKVQVFLNQTKNI